MRGVLAQSSYVAVSPYQAETLLDFSLGSVWALEGYASHLAVAAHTS